MITIKRLIIAISLAVLATISATSAQATITISVNGTTEGIPDTTNSGTLFSGTVDTWTIESIGALGAASFGGNGELFDVGTLEVSSSSTAPPTLYIRVTETDLTTAGATAVFEAVLSGLLNNIKVTNTLYLDTTNAGLESISLGSVTGTNNFLSSFSSLESLSGPFSLTDEIDLTWTGQGASLSSDDKVLVPEPASMALLGVGLLGFGLVRRRQTRKQRS